MSPEKEETNSLRHYLGRELSETVLPFSNWREIIENASLNSSKYISYYRFSKNEKTLSFAEYSHLCQRLGSFIRENYAIQEGDRVVVVAENRLNALYFYGALLWLGAVIVPINPTEHETYLAQIITRVKAKACLCDSKEFKVESSQINTVYLSEETINQLPRRTPLVFRKPLNLHSPAAIFFTSGTTGHSKGALLTHGQLLINSKATQDLHRMGTEHNHYCILPLFHVNAFSFSFLTTLYSASHLVLNQSFFQLSFWEELKKEKIHIVSLVPNVLKLLTHDKRHFSSASSELRYFVTAAAPLSKELMNEFYQKYRIPVVQAYGLSETVNFSLTVPPPQCPTIFESEILPLNPTTLGSPVYGNEVGIMDPDSGKLLGPNQKGEIVIRGWNVMQGYLEDNEATSRAFKNGWFHTGDLGYFELNGMGTPYFYIAGRLKEIMKRAGELISLQEVDESLRRIPGLENAVAVAFPNSYAGEELGLFVCTGSKPLTLESILRLCDEALPPFKKPKVVAFGNSIPQSPTGKIQRHLLVKHFLEYQDRCFR